MDGVRLDGSGFVIINDGSENYIRVVDVIAILSAEYSPKDRDNVAELLQGIVTSSNIDHMRMN